MSPVWSVELSCCYQLVHFHFCVDNFPNKTCHTSCPPFSTNQKTPPQKKTHEITQQAKPTKHHHPLSHHGPAGQGVCVHLFGEMHSCDLIPTVGGQFLLRCLHALGERRVELSWENRDVLAIFLLVGWICWWKPKLYKSLQKWCFFFKVQVQVRWGLADGTGTPLETN